MRTLFGTPHLALAAWTSLAAVFALSTAPVHAQHVAARATLVDTAGQRIGTAHLVETPSNGVLVQVELRDAPEGAHALHIHETGACSPTFEAAGGHFAPEGDPHGILTEGGEHAGDLLNIYVPPSGHVIVERLAREVTLEQGASASLLGGDGTALVVHERPDDYATQPAGDAGTRIACGVIGR
jgi:superoxide dismutase, Cu-Zn family